MPTLLYQNQTCGLQQSGKDKYYDQSPVLKFMGTCSLSDGGRVCIPTVLTVQASGRRAAQELLFEVFAEAFAHQVEGERVHTGVGEGQNASAHAGDEVAQWGVHLVVVVGAVQIDHVTGQPADSKQADKHQHSFGQTLPGLDLTGEQKLITSNHQAKPCNNLWWQLIFTSHTVMSTGP